MIRGVPLERNTRLNVMTPSGIQRNWIRLTKIGRNKIINLRMLPPIWLYISLERKIPRKRLYHRLILSIKWVMDSNLRLPLQVEVVPQFEVDPKIEVSPQHEVDLQQEYGNRK
jgi:hypothetical protein